MSKKKKRWYYVSYYSEYPIFEPAEGGYYYAGTDLMFSARLGSLKRARQTLKAWAKECDMKMLGTDYAINRSKYIGEDEFIRIETVEGVKISGRVPYC